MTAGPVDRAALERLIAALRPKLHRYCARMTGSVVDGEDVVQEALLNALAALPGTGPLANPEGWLFRVARNAALDFVRRRARRTTARASEALAMAAPPAHPVADRESARAGLRIFMRLAPAQRSSVILRDVLGYSLHEICAMSGVSVPAAKSALQRGRRRLQAIAREPDDAGVPPLGAADRARLARYVERFDARDFDAVRNMLADDVRLDLVNRLQARGRSEVGEYLHRYAQAAQWRFLAGLVDRRPAMLVLDRDDPAGRPAYFVLLEWRDDRVTAIRDFLFARYALDGADLVVLG